MTANPDYLDFTTAVSRLMAQLTGSPIVNAAAGWNSATLTFNGWERSVALLIQNAANIISLSISGVTTAFRYLNALPAVDGAVYYIPAFPAVDTQLTVSWYQVTAGSVTLYAIGSDEPLAHALFNTIEPVKAVTERLYYGMPLSCPINVITTQSISLDTTTGAVRCTVQEPGSYTWGKVVGNQSGTVYYDGSASNQKFPTTPIPVDRTADTSVTVSVQGGNVNTFHLYVSLLDVPDFAGSTPLVQAMSSSQLAPLPDVTDVPNQYPVINDGVIAASATVNLVAPVTGGQLRLHQLTIISGSTSAAVINLSDSAGNVFFKHHSSITYQITIPLFGRLCAKGATLQLVNTTAIASGQMTWHVDYSVL